MVSPSRRQPTERLSVRLPEAQLKQVDDLVTRGAYRNRQEAIADALRRYLNSKGLL